MLCCCCGCPGLETVTTASAAPMFTVDDEAVPATAALPLTAAAAAAAAADTPAAAGT